MKVHIGKNIRGSMAHNKLLGYGWVESSCSPFRGSHHSEEAQTESKQTASLGAGNAGNCRPVGLAPTEHGEFFLKEDYERLPHYLLFPRNRIAQTDFIRR
jgi:hypothetical protein